MQPVRSAYQTSYRYQVRPCVRRLLARLNISQNELARHCGITSGYMSQLLSGVRCPGPAMRRRMLAHIPGATFEDLFEEAGP